MTDYCVPAEDIETENRSVVGNSDLTRKERETSIRFNGELNTTTVYADNRAIVRSLVNHSEFEPMWYHLTDDGDICGVKGTFPIGLLKVKKSSRSTDKLSLVVSDQEEVDQSRFEDE